MIFRVDRILGICRGENVGVVDEVVPIVAIREVRSLVTDCRDARVFGQFLVEFLRELHRNILDIEGIVFIDDGLEDLHILRGHIVEQAFAVARIRHLRKDGKPQVLGEDRGLVAGIVGAEIEDRGRDHAVIRDRVAGACREGELAFPFRSGAELFRSAETAQHDDLLQSIGKSEVRIDRDGREAGIDLVREIAVGRDADGVGETGSLQNLKVVKGVESSNKINLVTLVMMTSSQLAKKILILNKYVIH